MNIVNSNKKVLIHYLFHSGFAIEAGDYFLVFDYYDCPGKVIEFGFAGNDIPEKIASCKYPFVFVSHSHHDHFSPSIFSWRDQNPQLTYVLSNDVKWKEDDPKHSLDSRYINMSPYEHVEKNGIVISTYGSTDIGVSFLVEVDGLKIFHAGDLNWWHWAEESTKLELEEEEAKFKNEVSKFIGEKIDIIFFPVDPRLGDYFWLGGAYMIEAFHPKLFVPMHFGEDCDIVRRFSSKMKQSGVPIFEITARGQEYEFYN